MVETIENSILESFTKKAKSIGNKNFRYPKSGRVKSSKVRCLHELVRRHTPLIINNNNVIIKSWARVRPAGVSDIPITYYFITRTETTSN